MLDQAEILRVLFDAFPRTALNKGTPRVYLKHLEDVPPAALERAVRHLIQTSTEPWLPTVGEIRRVVAEQTLALPSEQEALEQVDARIEWARIQEGRRPAPPAVHEVVQDALDLAGGYSALRTAENPAAARGAFLRHYRALRERAVADVQSPRALEAPPARAELEV